MWLLIPAKRATDSKSRLAPVLSQQARSVLARLLLARLLTLASHCEQIERGVVVSADIGLRTIAHLFGYDSLSDPEPGLNTALEAGRRYAIDRGAKALLVLPTDLPWLSQEALVRFLDQLQRPRPIVALVRDRRGIGTNALYQAPADAIPFSFGIRSGQRHMASAIRAGIPYLDIQEPAFAFDLDSPEDWAHLVA